MYSDAGQNLYNRSKMGATGISYTRFMNERTYYKLTLSGIYSNGGTQIDTLDNNNQNPYQYLDHNYAEFSSSLSGFINKKYNSQFSLRAGFLVDRKGFKLLTKMYNTDDKVQRVVLDDSRSLGDGVTLYQPYVQATYRFTDKLSIVPGLHFTYFDLNNASSVEPRIGLNWQLAAKQKLSLGYGLHSRTQSQATYFLNTHYNDGSTKQTNTNL